MKSQRQAKIVEIISNINVETQEQLLEMLQAVRNGKEIQVSIRETAGEERLFFSLIII